MIGTSEGRLLSVEEGRNYLNSSCMFYLQKPNINKEETHERLYHDKA